MSTNPLTTFFGIRWEPAPDGFACPRCKAPLERTRGVVLSSPWSGSVRCTKCEYQDSVVGYLGQSMFKVEPMPPAKLFFMNEPDLDSNDEPEDDLNE